MALQLGATLQSRDDIETCHNSELGSAIQRKSSVPNLDNQAKQSHEGAHQLNKLAQSSYQHVHMKGWVLAACHQSEMRSSLLTSGQLVLQRKGEDVKYIIQAESNTAPKDKAAI